MKSRLEDEACGMDGTLNYDELLTREPYGLNQQDKDALYNCWLPALQEHHACGCDEYARIVDVLGDNPAIPVRLFKEYDLRTAAEKDIFKIMKSSGTTGQKTSRVYLDRETSLRQNKALMRIVSHFLGTNKRVPLLVIDAEKTVRDRNEFSARTAGIRGFSMFGRDITFALHDDLSLNYDALASFEGKYRGEIVMIYGFTSIIWQYAIQPLLAEHRSFDLQGLLVHGGGWKKMSAWEVPESEFNAHCKHVLGEGMGISNYYGMAEQAGSISMQCEYGNLHASVFSDIEVVDPLTLEALPMGKRGVIKTFSLLPTSYPGHILLTEDEGVVLGVDDCPCGRLGRYFSVYGRQKNAELRGCSDARQ